MSIIGDWYDENYVQPMTKQIKEQKELLEECLKLFEAAKAPGQLYEIERQNIIKKLKSNLDIKK